MKLKATAIDFLRKLLPISRNLVSRRCKFTFQLIFTVAPFRVSVPLALIEIIEPVRVIPEESMVTELPPTFSSIDVAAVMVDVPALTVTE